MSACQKILAEKVLADQIFIFGPDDFPNCDLFFAAASGASISGTLDVTVTDCTLITSGITPTSPLQVRVTLMYQKELEVRGNPSAAVKFAPEGLPNPIPLEFKNEITRTLTFCNITQSGLNAIGVDLEDVECEIFKIKAVHDELEWTCGTISGTDDPTVKSPARIENTVTTLLKIKLLTQEDVVVSLCPPGHTKQVQVGPQTCGSETPD